MSEKKKARKPSFTDFLYRIMLTQTERAIEKGGPGHKTPGKKKPKPVSKEARIGEIIAKADFGCAKPAVREILSIALGKQVPEIDDDSIDSNVGMLISPLCVAVCGDATVVCLDGSDIEWLDCRNGMAGFGVVSVDIEGENDGDNCEYLDSLHCNCSTPTRSQIRRAASVLRNYIETNVDVDVPRNLNGVLAGIQIAWENMK